MWKYLSFCYGFTKYFKIILRSFITFISYFTEEEKKIQKKMIIERPQYGRQLLFTYGQLFPYLTISLASFQNPLTQVI